MEAFLQHPTNGQLGVFTPMYHREALQSRGPGYIYEAVARRMELDEPAIAARLAKIGPMLDNPELNAIPEDEVDDVLPYWRNEWLTGDDPRALLAILRLLRPKRYVEIGSGLSTRFARWAIQRWDLATKITAIDPAPRASVNDVADILIQKSVVDIDLKMFDELEAGDVLFHDGSHVTFNGADTTHLILEIMPRLRSGVAVHLHDIALPYEYPEIFDGRGYNEQYMLAAALLFSGQWRVTFPVHRLVRTNRISRGGGSFWIERT